MKVYLLLSLGLASCATFAPHPTKPNQAEPIITTSWPTYISPTEKARLLQYHNAFEGHPPVEVMDLEAAPDSIATVVAEQYFLPKKKAKRFLHCVGHHQGHGQ